MRRVAELGSFGKKKMKPVGRTYTVSYDMQDAQWKKLAAVYARMPEFIGFDKEGVPAWFGRKEKEKHLLASVEPSGLRVDGLLDEDDWVRWDARFREQASLELGFEVGDADQ
ncbi:MAG: hypothetical protein RLZZ15_578 [Verrucomicrobiota bacterium]